MSGSSPPCRVVFAAQAKEDAKKLSGAGLQNKTLELLELITNEPYQNLPRFERLVGNLYGALSRRINIQHHLVYQVVEQQKTVKVLRMWTHYE